MSELEIKILVESVPGVEYIGILHVGDELPQPIPDLVLFRAAQIKGSCIACRIDQLSGLQILLAAAAQTQRYQVRLRPATEIVVKHSYHLSGGPNGGNS